MKANIYAKQGQPEAYLEARFSVEERTIERNTRDTLFPRCCSDDGAVARDRPIPRILPILPGARSVHFRVFENELERAVILRSSGTSTRFRPNREMKTPARYRQIVPGKHGDFDRSDRAWTK